MRWKTKAWVQRTLSQLPGGRNVYELGQMYLGSLRHFNVPNKLRQARRLMEGLWSLGESTAGRTTMEIGTGPVPLLPLLCWLLGQKSSQTYDIVRMLNDSLTLKAAAQLCTVCETPEGVDVIPRQRLMPERLAHLRERLRFEKSALPLLGDCNIEYVAPADAAATSIESDSVDLVYSNTVLEHVPLEEIRRLFCEAHRVLRPGGFMLHLIDPSDHFAHSDGSISGINFLQFSEMEFRKYNTCFLYQNRLRASAYRRLVLESGFEIVSWDTHLNKRALEHLPTMRLHSDFHHLEPEEICAMSVRVVGRKSVASEFQ